MKKIYFLLLTLTFLLLITACGTNDKTEKNEDVDFPEKAIEIIVPYDAGGGTDIIARAVANKMGSYLPNNPSLNVVNKPGGTGSIGATEVYNSDPDGYKIGMFSNSAVTVQPHVTDTAYNFDDFEVISQLTDHPILVYVEEDSSFETLDDLIDYAKENPNKLKIGDSGAGGVGHLAAESFGHNAEIEFNSVHFDGGSPALTSLMGGHIDVVISPTASSSAGLKELAVIGDTSYSGLEDIPTTEELGIDVPVKLFVAAFAPKDTPEEIIEILNKSLKETLNDEEVQEQIKNIDVEPNHRDPEQTKEIIKTVYDETGNLLKGIDLTK